MTRFYVYPKGISGILLGEMITQSLAGGADYEVIYIDDALKGSSLEELKDEIIKGDYVVNLANNEVIGENAKTIEKLKEKLEKYKISYNEFAFAEYANKMAIKIEKDIASFGWSDVVGIELCGIANDKHIGYLDTYLLENSKANLLYLCATKNSLDNVLKRFENHRFKDRIYAVCFPLEYTQKFSFLKALCKTSITNVKNNAVPTIYLGHALNDWSNVDMEKYYGDKIDYLCIGNKKFAPKNLTSIKIIESGYLGFDLITKEIDNTKKDTIVFAPYNEEEFFKFFPFIKQILGKYRVIYRDRQFFEGKHLWREANEELEKLRGYGGFFVDNAWGMDKEAYSRGFAFVGGITTAINTFPILALAPSISDSKMLDLELGVRIDFKEKDEFLEVVDNIYKNRSFWKEKLLSYREQSFLNFGNASEALGRFIISRFLVT